MSASSSAGYDDGVGVSVLLLLIIGIARAESLYVFQRAVGLWRKEYDLSGNAADQGECDPACAGAPPPQNKPRAIRRRIFRCRRFLQRRRRDKSLVVADGQAARGSAGRSE